MRIFFAFALAFAMVQDANALEKAPFPFGYLEIEGDARYEAPRAYAGIDVHPRYRPVAGAEAALRESKTVGRALKLKFSLERASADSAEALAGEMDRLYEDRDVRFFVVDAPAETLVHLSVHAASRDILLFNVSETDDALRTDACAANLMHTMPSQAMLTDAMAQFLVASRWHDVLLLKGEFPEDEAQVRAFQRSAAKFGLKIVDVRDFVLGNDPRERDRNNVALMTGDADYDVVFIADSIGQVGRYIPYQTAEPRPVVGSEGLATGAWHWAWERYGAPQLNQRFERKYGRRMGDRDWAAWAAVRTVVEALVQSRSTKFEDISSFLKGADLTLDTYKGSPASFRSWNNQLRQPILIHTHNAVIERAPIEGFLHQTQYMDTLGFDRPESYCRF